MKVVRCIFGVTGLSRITLLLSIFVFALVIVMGIVGLKYLSKDDSNENEKSYEVVSAKEDIPPSIEEVPVQSNFVLGKDMVDFKDFEPKKMDVALKIPEYKLPLNQADIHNYDDFSKKIPISSKAWSILAKNGFAVMPTSKKNVSYQDDFVSFYQGLKEKNVPVFITSDTLLHYYHIFFSVALTRLEKDILYMDIWKMSKEFLDDSVKQYNSTSGDLKEAAKRNAAYFAVALELLKPKNSQVASHEVLVKEYCPQGNDQTCSEILNSLKERYGGKISFNYFSQGDLKILSFEIPDFVKDLVQNEIGLIEQHKGWENSPIFIYKEDYSQYVPRGHYTKSESLKNYFKAMMWYGRMTALIKDGIISANDAKIQTLQSSLIAKKFAENKEIQGRWQRIYRITSFFVGFSDDLGPYEYKNVLESLFNDKWTNEKFANRYADIKEALIKLPYSPKIYSGLGNLNLSLPCPPLKESDVQQLKIQAKELLETTKGFRMMGQRFTVDSYLLSEIVSPYSGEYVGDKKRKPFTMVKATVGNCPEGRNVRGFPRGLDIMALLGLVRAKEILKEAGDADYSDYDKKFSELKKEIDALPKKEWFKNIYWNWLYVLKSLPIEYEKGHQTFMQTKAWQDKELSAALASWSELRHDTILYVKQSYTMAEMGEGERDEPPAIVGYVEPVPKFYERLLSLTKLTDKGLKNLMSAETLEKLKVKPALDVFSGVIEKILKISVKELENKTLTAEEYYFIEDFGAILEESVKALLEGEADPDLFKTIMVADVHTDGNTRQVLEEGVGYIKILVAAYKLPNGNILIGAGPVLSYYEFKMPMNERLTDEAWRNLLDSKPPLEPEWIKTFAE